MLLVETNVFIVNRSSHDFSPAEQYGKLVFMTEGSFNRYATSRMFRAFEPFIENSKPEDFILLTSLNIMCSVVCSMFAAKHKRLNLLIWKKKDRKESYVKQTLVFGENNES